MANYAVIGALKYEGFNLATAQRIEKSPHLLNLLMELSDQSDGLKPRDASAAAVRTEGKKELVALLNTNPDAIGALDGELGKYSSPDAEKLSLKLMVLSLSERDPKALNNVMPKLISQPEQAHATLTGAFIPFFQDAVRNAEKANATPAAAKAPAAPTPVAAAPQAPQQQVFKREQPDMMPKSRDASEHTRTASKIPAGVTAPGHAPVESRPKTEIDGTKVSAAPADATTAVRAPVELTVDEKSFNQFMDNISKPENKKLMENIGTLMGNEGGASKQQMLQQLDALDAAFKTTYPKSKESVFAKMNTLIGEEGFADFVNTLATDPKMKEAMAFRKAGDPQAMKDMAKYINEMHHQSGKPKYFSYLNDRMKEGMTGKDGIMSMLMTKSKEAGDPPGLGLLRMGGQMQSTETKLANFFQSDFMQKFTPFIRSFASSFKGMLGAQFAGMIDRVLGFGDGKDTAIASSGSSKINGDQPMAKAAAAELGSNQNVLEFTGPGSKTMVINDPVVEPKRPVQTAQNVPGLVPGADG